MRPLPTTDYRLPTTDYRLPTIDYLLPSTYFEKSVHTPIAMNPPPAMRRSARGEAKRSSCVPTITPIAAARVSAQAEPAKMTQRLTFISLANSIVANCVLSPISATNTVAQTVKKTRHRLTAALPPSAPRPDARAPRPAPPRAGL